MNRHNIFSRFLTGIMATALTALPAAGQTPPAGYAHHGIDRSRLAADPLILKRSDTGLETRPLAIALHLGVPGAEARLEQWLADNESADADERASAWLLLCEERFRKMRYKDALLACRESESIVSGSAEQMIGLLTSLAEIPPARWTVTGLNVPLFKDSDGTRRLHIQTGEQRIEAIIDTGAEISVVMESVARRLGAKLAAQPATVGTTTTPVSGGIEYIERLRIGGGELLNVPVLVLPDEQLTFADGTSIPAILGLSALTAAGKAAFLRNGTGLALGTAVPDVPGLTVPIFWHPSGMGFEAQFAKGARAVFLDTGSRRNYLFPNAEPFLSDAELRTKTPFQRKIMGIGGERIEDASRFDTVTLQIAGHLWAFTPMEMAPEDETGEAAVIGAAIMDRFETVVIDFETMSMQLSE